MAAAAGGRLCALLLTVSVYGATATSSQCGQQLDTVLAEYDRSVPPATSPLVVEVSLDVRHASVYDSSSTIHLLADLHLKWQEERLSWNASEWGCESALVAAERLWLPDVALANAAVRTGGGADEQGLRARLSSTGAVAWISRLDVTVPVALQLDRWPADQQKCTFNFMSREYDKDYLDLNITKSKQLTVWMSGSWGVTSVVGATWEWRREGSDRSVAGFEVTVQRRARAHSLATGAVLCAAALLLLAAVLLPPVHRPPLCAVAAFIAALWLISALLRLPSSSSSPLALRVMCALCASGAACAACAGLVVRVQRRASPAPRALRSLLATVSRNTTLIPNPDSEGETGDGVTGAGSGAWTAAALLLDRACAVVLVVTLLVLLCVYIA